MSVPRQVLKVPRAMLVERLRERDGDRCQYPGCTEPELDFSVKDGPREPTIDHWFPQYWAKQEGWTPDEIWDLSNLKLMSKACNARKGDRIPNEDGTLPPKPQSTFRFRRERRATRVGMCDICDNGHNLLMGEVCASCGGNAQAFPKSAKVKYNECDHELFWCPWCSIGVVERTPSVDVAVRHAESGEWGTDGE